MSGGLTAAPVPTSRPAPSIRSARLARAVSFGPMENSSPPFSQAIVLRWADLDPNGHVRHSVYYDWGAMVRVAYLESKGVGLKWMAEHAIGPAALSEATPSSCRRST